MGKFCRVRQAADDNMAQARCMLDAQGYNYKHSEYVTFIAFPLQQCLHERASLLRYTFIVSLLVHMLSLKVIQNESFGLEYYMRSKIDGTRKLGPPRSWWLFI